MRKTWIIVVLIIGLLFVFTSCTKSPPELPPLAPQPTKPLTQQVPIPETVTPTPTLTSDQPNKELEDLRDKYPYLMVDQNGFLVVSVSLNSYYGASHLISLAIMISNFSNTTLHTNPLYFTLIDTDNTAYQYDSNTYSDWKELAFRGIDLPSGTNKTGVLNFRLNISAKPKLLIYDDGKTPPITMSWRDNPDIKP